MLFYESWRVVVVDSFGVSESFEDRITQEQLLSDGFQGSGLTGGRGDVLQQKLRGFRLTRTALARNDNGLVALQITQRPPSCISNSVSKIQNWYLK